MSFVERYAIFLNIMWGFIFLTDFTRHHGEKLRNECYRTMANYLMLLPLIGRVLGWF